MRNVLRTLVFVAAATATPAVAADLAVKAVPGQQVYQAVNWTGLYLGGQVGYLWGNVRNNTLNTTVDAVAPRGAFGGVQVGYNVQLPSNVVLGVELTLPLFSNAESRVPEPTTPGQFYIGRVLYGGTLTAKLGYAVDRYLPYAFFGAVYGRGEARIESPFITESRETDHFGWTVGAGLEVALSRNWSVFGRYAYLQMSDRDYAFSFGARNFGFDAHTASIGVNYRF